MSLTFVFIKARAIKLVVPRIQDVASYKDKLIVVI